MQGNKRCLRGFEVGSTSLMLLLVCATLWLISCTPDAGLQPPEDQIDVTRQSEESHDIVIDRPTMMEEEVMLNPDLVSMEYSLTAVTDVVELGDLTVMNGTLYMTAVLARNHSGLYRVEGRNISLVTDDFLSISGIVTADMNLYFIGEDGAHGKELWVSDGTESDTRLVKDIRPGPGGSDIGEMAAFRGHLYFGANDGEHGNELWRSDGTEGGTELVADIHPTSSSNPAWLTAVDQKMFFSALAEDIGRELWVTDGTHTKLVMQVNSSYYDYRPTNLRVVNNDLFFTVGVGSASIGKSLYWIDGSTTEIRLLTIDSGFVSDKLRLSNINRVTGEFISNPISSSSAFDYIQFPVVAKSRLFFSSGYLLWWSDGLEAQLVTDSRLRPILEPRNLLGSADLLFFAASDKAYGEELWRSDGTEEGTFMIADINPVGGSFPVPLFYDQGWLYFVATDGENGRKLWVTNGLTDQVILVSDPAWEKDNLSVLDMVAAQGDIYFVGSMRGQADQLWRLHWED